MKPATHIFLLFIALTGGCNSSPSSKKEGNKALTRFINSVQMYSRPLADVINLDTLRAEHFPIIPFHFFNTYYSKHIKSAPYNLSIPPSDSIYWRFSFLTYERGRLFDFQRIVGYFEESGVYIYLVVLDKKSHRVLTIHEIAYSGGDGSYFETDQLTYMAPGAYMNRHTISDTDEQFSKDDSVRTNLTIYTFNLGVNPYTQLTVDTVSERRTVKWSSAN